MTALPIRSGIIPALLSVTLAALCYDRLVELRAKHAHINLMVLAYLLKLVKMDQFNKELHYLSPEERLHLRTEATSSFKTTVRLRNVIIATIREGLDNTHGLRLMRRISLFEDYGLSAADISVIPLLQCSPYWNKLVRTAKSKAIAAQPLHPDDVLAKATAFHSEIATYLKKYSYKKLYFIATSNGKTVDDLVQDITAQAVRAYYQRQPFLTDAHAVNLMKRSAVNFGTNTINYYNRGKRARLTYSEQEGYTNIIQTLTQETAESVGGNIREGEDFEIATARFRQRVKGRKELVFNLLLMHDHRGFVEFVNKHILRRSRCTTVEQVYEKMDGLDFLEAIRQFVQVKKEAFYRFVAEIKEAVLGLTPQFKLAA